MPIKEPAAMIADLRAIVVGGLLAGAILAAAQSSPLAQEASAPEPGQPGFFSAIGRRLDESMSNLAARLRQSREELGAFQDQATSNARDAASAVARLPMGKLTEGREKCDLVNGAPDCRTAATKLCRTAGFADGQSVDVRTFQKCPTQVWLSGRSPSADECSGESYVTRAVCQ